MARRRSGPPPSNVADLRGGPTPGRFWGLSGVPPCEHPAPGHEDEGVYRWDGQQGRPIAGENAVAYSYNWLPAETSDAEPGEDVETQNAKDAEAS